MPVDVRIQPLPAPDAPLATMTHADYALALRRAVRGDGVDYRELRADRAPLERFLGRLAAVGPQSTPALFLHANEALAYRINAYNAAVLWAISAQGRDGDPLAAPPRDPETGYRFLIDGRRQSAADLRRAILRGAADDWRVPLALCNGRRDSPPLADKPYLGDLLDAQLGRQVQHAIASRSAVLIDHGWQKLLLCRELYAARDRLVADYERRTGARDATVLNVLIELAPREQHHTLNAAVGYDVETMPPDDRINQIDVGMSMRPADLPRGTALRAQGARPADGLDRFSLRAAVVGDLQGLLQI